MEVTGACEPFDLDDSADVGAVRRRFAALAAAAGLDEARTGDAALIATELASNVLKHARRGGALLGIVHEPERRGVAIATWDRGPGMNLSQSLRDGTSTAGTRGVGLGAVARLATWFDAYTMPGRGSVVVAAIFPKQPARAMRFAVGAASVPYPGLSVCGDAWASYVSGERITVLVCDGLGHGEGAAAAAAAVVAAFGAAPDDPLTAILDRADHVARSTRGAAATVARIDLASHELAIAGVGNVAAWIAGDTLKQLVTQHGTLGHATPSQIREERHSFAPGALLVMCSDGIKSRWSFEDHPGLVVCQPATIATVMWRDLSRERDDASVVVVCEAAR
ncbi:MAG TPA: SpoIIE family protein phosphatase [Kofleriaceae bacterium]|jgi:anti-sigma regulatory factor (Ser/Thr protein kinase)|nr:SpoIIE family protein phosphatase [Kofleriaceae bacterium]